MPERLSMNIAIKLRILNFLNKFFRTHRVESYSHLGEDVALLHILRHKYKIRNGIYVDVGCNHPRATSNTFLLYVNGWRGVTVDVNKELVQKHEKERKLDTQFCAAISNKKEQVVVFIGSNSQHTTIDSKHYEDNKQDYENKSEVVNTSTLNDLLAKTEFTNIDLLCIDAEGHDFEVLQSLSLEIYTPKMIVIEMHDCDIDNIQNHVIYSYLKKYGYSLEGYLFWNGYFIHDSIKK